jgi:hypothetical protein
MRNVQAVARQDHRAAGAQARAARDEAQKKLDQANGKLLETAKTAAEQGLAEKKLGEHALALGLILMVLYSVLLPVGCAMILPS